jgi:hypothetical protein
MAPMIKTESKIRLLFVVVINFSQKDFVVIFIEPLCYGPLHPEYILSLSKGAQRIEAAS